MYERNFEVIVTDRAKQRKKERIALIITVVICLILIALPIGTWAYDHYQTEENYQQGIELIEKGQYKDAKERLEAVGDIAYKDTYPLTNFCNGCLHRAEGLYHNAHSDVSDLDFNYIEAEQEEKIRSEIEKINKEFEINEKAVADMWKNIKDKQAV